MARKKAAVIAINSLCTLNNSKSLILINSLNTWAAAERWDFHSSDGHSNSETAINYQQASDCFRVSGERIGGTGVNHQSQYLQNGYYKDSSQQISSGVYGTENTQRVDGQRGDFGEHHYGGAGNGSSGHLNYGRGSSWQSGIPSQNSYDSFQHGGFRDQQNVGSASTSTHYSSHIQSNYSASNTHVGSTMPQQTYSGHQSVSYGYQQQFSGNYYGNHVGTMSNQGSNGFQSANYDQNAMMPSQGLGNTMPAGESSDANLPQGTLEELDTCCKEGKIKEVVEVLGLLEKQGICVDLPRYLDLLKICNDEEALEEAKSVHKHLVKSLSEVRVSTYNKILQMYARCGSMGDADTVFSKMLERNLTSWDTMISGYARNGLGEEAIDMFTRFKEAGLRPDGQIFIGVFDACAVTGDVIEGMLHFESMSKVYGIVPNMKHYMSIVNMLGASGHLNEALKFIQQMPVEPSLDVWVTLMNLSRVQGNSEIGNLCAEIVGQLDPSHLTKETKAGLVPIRASDLSKEKEKKKSGQTSLELRSKIHEYRAGDKSHPENDRIYALLRGMKEQMKEAGYVPDCRFVLHDIDQEGKEEALMAHSERLATAYGLITTSARSPIRVIKNLRVCVDCHNAFKIVSSLVGRELIMRDAKRFHHMKDGKCSCNDYW